MTPAPKHETARLRLRELADEDAPFIRDQSG